MRVETVDRFDRAPGSLPAGRAPSRTAARTAQVPARECLHFPACGRTPEQEVGIIADKFPELSGMPCEHHGKLVLGDMLGNAPPMNGQVPIAGGREVEVEGERGFVFDESPEAQAFSRWQQGEFLDVERGAAKLWRVALASLNLARIAENMRALGIDPTTCRSLDEAHAAAINLIRGQEKGYERLILALHALQIPGPRHAEIVARWAQTDARPLIEFAPYAAHVLSVEMFFQFALGARLIGAERASNRVDVAYLYYTPFCNIFISSDRLQRDALPISCHPIGSLSGVKISNVTWHG